MIRRPHVVIDPVIPFSLAQSPKAPKPPYGCSECCSVFFEIGKAQAHILDKHPFKYTKPKRKNKAREKIIKPDARQRADIRRAILEAKQRKLL